MDTEQARKLHALKGLSLQQLRTADPDLAHEVELLLRRSAALHPIRPLQLPQQVMDALEHVEVGRLEKDVRAEVRQLLLELRWLDKDIDELLQRIPTAPPGPPRPPPPPASPVGNQPVVAQQLAAAQVKDIVTIAALPDAAAKALAGVAAAPNGITDLALSQLVAGNQLTAYQARATGLAASIYRLTGENVALATAINTGAFATLGGKAPSTPSELAALAAADWSKFFTTNKVVLPAGITADTLGVTLTSRFAALYPEAAFFGRIAALDPQQLLSDINSLAPLLRQHPKVVGVPMNQLSTGLADAQLATLLGAHQRLTQLVNTYPGLQLAAVLDDVQLAPQAKVDTVVKRVGYIGKINATLGQTSLLQLNLATDSPDLAKLGLGALGATAQEQQMVLQTLQSYQRVWTLSNDVDQTLTLLQSGFDSGISIGRLSLADFQAQSGLASAQAQTTWETARGSLADVSLTAGSIIDIIHGLPGNYGNQSPSAEDYLKQLAGFQDLFGKLSLCNCQECQSILGPAAYFVDLMKFIDEYLRVQFTTPNHPLDLKTRRPDLWTLELSCDNTNNRIALLDIVNPVLENYSAAQLGYTGSLSDRNAIGDLVYRQTLATHVDSFAQPFTLPLARLASYLTQFSNTRTDVAVALAQTPTVFTQTELDLATLDYTLITTPDVALANLSHIYGIAFGGTAAAVNQVDASVLDVAMGLTRDELGALAATNFVAAGGASVSIVAAKLSADSVQNDVEWVQGLTADALDRMHRFTRLLGHTGWAVADLDLVLQTLGDHIISAAGAQSVAQLHAIMQRLSVTTQDAVALIGPLPQTPPGQSLFDQLFNDPSYVAADGVFPQPLTHFVHPAFRQNTAAPIDPNLPRLLSGLSVSLDGLASLARHLAPYLYQEATLGFNPNAANENDRYFVLSAPNLTLLYRHARLARLLGLAIEDLFELIGFIPIDHLTTLSDLLTVLNLQAWYQQSNYRLDDIAIATGQTPHNRALYPDAPTVAAGIVTAASTALTFTNTMFAVSLGTTEKGSADLVTSNAALIEALPNNAYRLVAGVDLSSAVVTIPASATVPTPPSGTRAVTVGEVRTALRPYLASELLIRSVGKTFNISRDKVLTLAALAGQSLTADALVKAVRGDGPVAPLTQFVASLLPLNVVFSDPVWDAAALTFVNTNAALFGAGPLPSLVPDAQHPNAPFLTLPQLRALSVYTRIANRQTGTAPNTAPVAPADLQAVLLAFVSAPPGFPPASDSTMARVLNVAAGLVVGLRGAVTLPSIAASALDQLDGAAQLATAFGVDGNTFSAIVSSDYATLSQAADALTAVLRSRITDATALAGILEQLEQPVRAAKRDALTDYLIRSITPQIWTTNEQLYEYFLIDVNAGGCQTTSLVVAATMSAQLYFYRALMNLEQDDRPPTDPAHFVLTVPAEAALEWDWRKNYRVWQANREVFLWPENYMVPDLRDDKTPLFEEIEQELLQTSLTDQDVLDAYTKYLAGLNEVATLSIAGAYHEIMGSSAEQSSAVGGISDVLHLFGCSADDPPVYYYRTCQNLISGKRQANTGPIWSPWQKVTVQITGRRVAPVMHFGRLHVFWNDIKTNPRNQVSNGGSQFAGYKHQMRLKYTTLRADGQWTTPQQLRLPPGPVPAQGQSGLLSDPYTSMFGPARGMVLDPLYSIAGKHAVQFDLQQRDETEAIDDYTLSGPNWDGIWPYSWSIGGASGLECSYRNFMERRQIDLFGKTVFDLASPWTTDAQKPYPQLLCAKQGGDTKPLYWGVPNWMPYPNAANANLVIDEVCMNIIEMDTGGPGTFKPWLTPGLYVQQIATIPSSTQLLAVPGSVEDGIVQVGNDVLLLQGSVTDDGQYVLTRIGTTLVDTIARKLFEDGIDAVLDIQTQLQLAEAGLPITLVGGNIVDRSNTGELDFLGAYGVYYREVFFYLPWLIGSALNSLGSYESSHNWYRYIFDPTANETINVTGLSPTEAAHRVLDRVWRYREFRGLDLVTLRNILTDPAAIALYKRDPFNPWAIARRRISAFQKAIVMAMVSNLFDWADSLFTQFTMETVNEAMMLYVMASDILGPRPVTLGDCGAGVTPDNYATIGPLIDSSSEILIELETWIIGWRYWNLVPAVLMQYAVENKALNHVVTRFPLEGLETQVVGAQAVASNAAAGGPGAAAVPAAAAPVATAPVGTTPVGPAPVAAAVARVERPSLFTGMDWQAVRTAGWAPALANRTVKTNDVLGGRTFNNIANKGSFAEWVGRFGYRIITQLTPVFCVPANATLLAYWDRLDDRLYKIHHCQDINGNLRQLALFAPPINPMQLVAMQAAGLSLDDVLGAGSGDLPPYRFTALIERAKSFAATLSGFGSSLLSALEKKDAEQLNRLRLTQQMNIAQMTTQVRQAEIDAAQAALDSLNAQLASAQYRSSFYDGLISEDRSAGEYVQTAAVHTASGIKALEGTLGLVSATLSLIPEVGSPFAMKYGGVALGSSMSRFADTTGCLAAVAEAVGTSAGLESTFERRSEGWKNLKQLADNDVTTLNKQITGANIRLNIANDALNLHLKGIDQIQELIDLADNRFTNLGLYTWLAGQLQLLYRGAYQNALAIAMLAQQAYSFERGDDTLPGLSLNYWDPTYAGLLAGERLLIDLQSLERRYLETNYRTLEIDQPFPLSQLDPQALLDLRETGECTFTISEVFADLFYPGHYKRRIKAVRLTIPCVTGPYVNVSATLTLLDSWVRPTATPGAPLVEVPPSRSVAIATSTAQNDGGVFELLFRDERYMPFEGLGVISQWNLRLPKAFPQFDYRAINDAVVWISYQSLLDGALRDRVEATNAALAGSIVNYFTNNPARRLLSLRQDFSSVFSKLLRSPAGTQVSLTLSELNMPLFAKGRALTITRGVLILRTANGAAPVGFTMTVDGTALANSVLDPTLGNLPVSPLPGAFTANLYANHVLVITAAGNLAPAAPVPGDTSAIDAKLLLDTFIYLEYQFQ